MIRGVRGSASLPVPMPKLFANEAQEWMVRAQGYARPEHVDSLAEEMGKAYELGYTDGQSTVVDDVGTILEESTDDAHALARLRALVEKWNPTR